VRSVFWRSVSLRFLFGGVPHGEPEYVRRHNQHEYDGEQAEQANV
jgi:hypothetical protein